MSYKYDPENGYRNADQIGADTEEFNPDLYNIVQAIKKTKDTRMAINILSAYIKGMKDYQEFTEELQITKDDKNLVQKIQSDMNYENSTKDIQTKDIDEREA